MIPFTGIMNFKDFYRALYARDPFPWQERLAEQVVTTGTWPAVIDLPTASGKTTCIDIAVFALATATAAKAPRRIFFVVDRRVIVDEAYRRMQAIRDALAASTSGILAEVASRLRTLSGGGPDAAPLKVHQLRGGIYRDESWVRSPLQPALIASTVDQVGSRILFRGYGVSDSSLPIHAALVANDSLILLDEAHCSKPFALTLDRIHRYRSGHWAAEEGNPPFAFVEMTATPSRPISTPPFQLDDNDREVMQQRLRAPKQVTLSASKAKSSDAAKLAADLIKQAKLLAQKEGVRRIAIMVNRVATARAVAAGLKNEETTLIIGRMRPYDRARLEEKLEPLHTGRPRNPDAKTEYIVATQCLEVGADLDFDALITECASMDALLQRFGRCNRIGAAPLGGFGCIVLPAVDPKKPDPIYGQALDATRAWLESLASPDNTLDLSLEGSSFTIPALWRNLSPEQRAPMLPLAPQTPALLPAHLDTLAQTSPRPTPEPSISFFLHGAQPASADINVVWRADLDKKNPETWADIVSLAPPVTAEALPVPLWEFQSWMRNKTIEGVQSDVEGISASDSEGRNRKGKNNDIRPVLLWGGAGRQMCTNDAGDIRPGDTIVLPASYRGDDILGHVMQPLDVADSAFLQVRNKVRIRLHAALVAQWPATQSATNPLKAIRLIADDPQQLDWNALLDLLKQYLSSDANFIDSLVPVQPIQALLANPTRNRYFQEESKCGLLVTSRGVIPAADEEDSGNDESSSGDPITLHDHTLHVRESAEHFSRSIYGTDLATIYGLAAEWHDAGKADPRFQILLNGGDPFAAQFCPTLLAKGRFVPRSQRQQQRDRSGLPDRFRHELISLQLAAKATGADLPETLRDLFLHLIATHHGYCRPFAPVVLDSAPNSITISGQTLTGVEQTAAPAHRLDSGIAARFWRLLRLYGWWGLPYHEALFRLADWNASSQEQPRNAPSAQEAKA